MTEGPMLGADSLQAYFHRVGLAEAPGVNAAGLRALHLAHATHIPFENLDIQLGLPIRLDLDSLLAKLVQARRGGYCFEQNTLFRAVLQSLGFYVDAFEARVRLGTSQVLPRTHMLLRVSLPEGAFLADVGFGGQGLLQPVRMEGEPVSDFGREFRVAGEGELRVLQTREGLAWQDLYAFVPEPRPEVDFEMANWYTSTHPASRFVATLTAQRRAPGEHHILRGLSYTEVRGESAAERTLTRQELLPLLRDVFGLDLPPDARFRSLEGAGSFDPQAPGNR